MTASWASSDATRASMRANKRRDTSPELAVRRLVHAAGLRYRVDYPPLPTNRRMRADLVFTRLRVAVFIDGCFWHGCPDHLYPPKTNVDYWASKINGNRERDQRTTDQLTNAAWTVLRFWEHDPPAAVAAQIVSAIVHLRADSEDH